LWLEDPGVCFAAPTGGSPVVGEAVDDGIAFVSV